MKIAIKYVEFDFDPQVTLSEQPPSLTYCEWSEDGGEKVSAYEEEIPRHVREALALEIAPWLVPKQATT